MLAVVLVALVAGLACSAASAGRQPSPPTAEPLAADTATRADNPGLPKAPPTVTSDMSQVVANTEPPSHGGVRAGDQAAARSEATVTDTAAPTVEELLEEGLHRAGASPVHLAIRGAPAAASVRCAWRGVARTAQQREDAIRFWLRLGPTEAIPDATYLEILFAAVLDSLDRDFRETAKANFLAIARGGESMDYLFLTCFADYAVTNFLLGTGTTPTTVTVAYDRMDEAASYRPVRAGARHGHVRN